MPSTVSISLPPATSFARPGAPTIRSTVARSAPGPKTFNGEARRRHNPGPPPPTCRVDRQRPCLCPAKHHRVWRLRCLCRREHRHQRPAADPCGASHMLSPGPRFRASLAVEPVDLRAGMDCQAGAVRGLGLDPLQGQLWLFLSQSRRMPTSITFDGSARCVTLEPHLLAVLPNGETGRLSDFCASPRSEALLDPRLHPFQHEVIDVG
jgi:hypothetical protein